MNMNAGQLPQFDIQVTPEHRDGITTYHVTVSLTQHGKVKLSHLVNRVASQCSAVQTAEGTLLLILPVK